jgi:hypothetical protein
MRRGPGRTEGWLVMSFPAHPQMSPKIGQNAPPGIVFFNDLESGSADSGGPATAMTRNLIIESSGRRPEDGLEEGDDIAADPRNVTDLLFLNR